MSQMMEGINSMPMEDDEDDLSRRISTSLMISSTKEITKIDTSFCQLPMKRYDGLYSNNLLEVETSLQVVAGDQTPPIRNRGVPGFPDFPDRWCGGAEVEEQWACAAWQRNFSSNRTHQRQRAEEIQQAHRSIVLKRLKRQEVLPPPPKTITHNKEARMQPHKAGRRKMLLSEYRQQREMLILQKNLKQLSFK